jgi:hypothetical protein
VGSVVAAIPSTLPAPILGKEVMDATDRIIVAQMESRILELEALLGDLEDNDLVMPRMRRALTLQKNQLEAYKEGIAEREEMIRKENEAAIEKEIRYYEQSELITRKQEKTWWENFWRSWSK